MSVSLPSRGAWIENYLTDAGSALLARGRSPHGERGLKTVYTAWWVNWPNVAPLTGSVD